MKKSRFSLGGLIGVLAIAPLSVVACTHGVPAGARIVQEGRTSVRALKPPDATLGAAEATNESVTPAYASSENKVPEYPVYALKAGCRVGTVPVRIYVGADGNVTNQRDIPERPLPSDGCHLAFRAAVQSAVSQWKFAPAYRMTAVPGLERDGQAGITRWNQSPIAIYLDFEFFFEVVEGRGVVHSR